MMVFISDNTVYCYEPDDLATSFIQPCLTGWTSTTIENRFGSGIPESPDDVVGNRDQSWDFYFLKGNSVWKSVGDSVAGSLDAEYPIHIHTWDPRVPCNVTAIMLGLNIGEKYSVRGNQAWLTQDGYPNYINKGNMCHVNA